MSSELVPFVFDGREVRTITIGGEPWVVVADICAVLELGNTTKAIRGLRRDDLKRIQVMDALGRSQETSVVNEPGLYQLIFRSYKPEAERFRDWICREVLPSIRKTGQFTVNVPLLLPAPQRWQKTFQDEFFQEVFRLKGKTPVPYPKAPWLAQVIRDVVYRRLPDGVSDTLELLNPIPPGCKYRQHKQHQFIERTTGQFEDFLSQLIGGMKMFLEWEAFYAAWNRLHPIQRDLPGHLAFVFADSQQQLFPFAFELIANGKRDNN
jgi:prophage antirepressor-like protein